MRKPSQVDGEARGELFKFRRWPDRLKRFVSENILQLNDTPHRIALGVCLGFMIGASPTVGIQMILYFVAVTLIGANRVSGLGPIWLSNPLTMVPIYYTNWRIGRFLLTGDCEASAESKAAIAELVADPPGGQTGWFTRFLSLDFWQDAVAVLFSIGGELWLGSLLVGALLGGAGYYFTYRALTRSRRPS